MGSYIVLAAVTLFIYSIIIKSRVFIGGKESDVANWLIAFCERRVQQEEEGETMHRRITKIYYRFSAYVKSKGKSS